MKDVYIRFHFKIDKDLKDALSNYCEKNEISFCTALNQIFLMSYHFIERKSFKLSSVKFPIEPEQCDDMDIYLEYRFKNLLYKLQGDFNLRSKAAVVRFMLRIFLRNFADYNTERLHRFIIATFGIWEKGKAATMEWTKFSPHIRPCFKDYIVRKYDSNQTLLKISIIPPYPPPD